MLISLYRLPILSIILSFIPVLVYVGWRVLTSVGYKSADPAREYPPIGIVIPVYNGSETLDETMQSIRKAAYVNEKHIIIVDDGSDKGVLPFIRYNMDATVIRHKVRQGKRAALESGILETQARNLPIVVTVDADTTLKSDALMRIVSCFTNPKVGAVSGNVRVSNRTNLVTRLTASEYWWGITFVKTGQSQIGSVLIASGCFSAFRNAALHMTDVWQHTNVSEDMDLSTYTLMRGWRSVFALDAIAYTESPTAIESLLKQRVRWYRGNVQMQKDRAGLFKKRDTIIEAIFNLIFSPFGIFIEMYALIIALLANTLLLGIAILFTGEFLGTWLQCAITWHYERFTDKLRYAILLPLYSMLIMKPTFVYAALTANKKHW